MENPALGLLAAVSALLLAAGFVIVRLRRAVVSLRGEVASASGLYAHLKAASVPREMLTNQRSLQARLLAGLIAHMRQHLEADSPLASCIEDYTLLMQMESNAPIPEPVSFDLAQVLHEAQASARRLHPPRGKVHLTTSLQAGTKQHWLGQPLHLEALLRNLLLIALRRTRAGLICLRLEIVSYAGCDTQALLTVRLDDSGPPMQRGQWMHWLEEGRYAVTPRLETLDVPWFLTGRLFQLLGGSVNGDSPVRGGLTLEGSVMLLMPETDREAPAPQEFPLSVAARLNPPLALAVEDNVANAAMLARMFAQLGFRLFVVENHEQAVGWGPVLPFSAILLNTTLDERAHDACRRLQTLKEEGLMPDVPLWTLMVQDSFLPFERWRQAGVSELLLKPVKPDLLRQLCLRLPPFDPSFYHARDARVTAEFSENITGRQAALQRELAAQLAPVQRLAEEHARSGTVQKGVQEAHAVKSAALTLGYYRLAACMAEIENAIRRQDFAQTPENWSIVADCLKNAGI